MDFKELIKDLDKNLAVKEVSRDENDICITCEMNTTQCKCPYCMEESDSVHSRYIRRINDLPIQNKGVKLILIARKFFCHNPNCNHKTFGERYSFVEPQAVKTNRLNEYINKIGLRSSSMDTVRDLKETGIKISSNTVLRVIKKNKN